MWHVKYIYIRIIRSPNKTIDFCGDDYNIIFYLPIYVIIYIYLYTVKHTNNLSVPKLIVDIKIQNIILEIIILSIVNSSDIILCVFFRSIPILYYIIITIVVAVVVALWWDDESTWKDSECSNIYNIMYMRVRAGYAVRACRQWTDYVLYSPRRRIPR